MGRLCPASIQQRSDRCRIIYCVAPCHFAVGLRALTQPEPASQRLVSLGAGARSFPSETGNTAPRHSALRVGDTQRYIYFPADAIVSLLYVLKNGASAEIAVVGKDGAIGIALFMGGATTTNRAIVQSAGDAFG